jgi:hypothetical protein
VVLNVTPTTKATTSAGGPLPASPNKAGSNEQNMEFAHFVLPTFSDIQNSSPKMIAINIEINVALQHYPESLSFRQNQIISINPESAEVTKRCMILSSSFPKEPYG